MWLLVVFAVQGPPSSVSQVTYEQCYKVLDLMADISLPGRSGICIGPKGEVVVIASRKKQ